MRKIIVSFVLAFIFIGCSEPMTSDLTTKQVYNFRVKSGD